MRGVPRPARPPVLAPCGAAPASSPGLLSCPGVLLVSLPVSRSCPGVPVPAPVTPSSLFSCPSTSPPRPHPAPASSQCPPPAPVLSPQASRPVPVPPRVLPCSLWGAGTGPHPSVRGHVTGPGVSPWPPGTALQGGQGDGAQGTPGSGLVGRRTICHRAPEKAPLRRRWGCRRPDAPPGPAALPEHRGGSESGADIRSRSGSRGRAGVGRVTCGGLAPARWPRPPLETSPRGLERPTSPSHHWGDMGARRDRRQLSLW